MNKETINTKNEQRIMKREQAGALATNVFEADANQGAQNITQEDLALPFLKVLGQLSPEVNKLDAKHVEGAQPGMILNTVTNQLYDGTKGIQVMPVFYKRQYIEWQERGEGKGAPIHIYDVGDDIPKVTRDKQNKDRLANGNYLENTANHFVVVLGDSPSTALISMKSTQLKISKKWNSMMLSTKMPRANGNGVFTPPTYSHIYKLKTVQQSNDKGTWFGWDVSKVGPVTDKTVYDIAKNFAVSVSKGEVKAKHETDESKTDVPF
jgi:hypothetical protein|tara:strand:+ start:56 stop:850 length:795 start_codon:yes stop_codon:yes gene_type:complete